MADVALARGRELFDRRAWQDCWAALSAADGEASLGADDLLLLSISAYLAGEDDRSADALGRAHRDYLDSGDVRLAARSAFWLAFMLLNTGEQSRGNGWAARSRRLVDEHRLGGAEEALLDVLAAHGLANAGQSAAALTLAEQAAHVGLLTGDPDLRSLALLTVARSLLGLGRGNEALDRMDEVIVTVSVDEVNPIVVGLAYCAATATCLSLFDLRRAREWTSALTGWCDAQSGLVPYRGQCLLHRAQIMTLQGAWSDALDETVLACDRLPHAAAGEALYQLGELHRLMGAFEKAEDAFRKANSWGRRPEPGLVRLRMAQGRLDAAATTIRRLYSDEHDGLVRAEMVVVFIEVMLAVGDTAAAGEACRELTALADDLDSPMLHARAAQCAGAVGLARGDAEAALGSLRHAWRAWQELGLPYDAARTRELIGRCLRALGDEDAAQMELDSARAAFDHLGAAPDVQRVALLVGGVTRGAGELTPREVEVIRLVASGRTNRAVANELFLSEKTVARHLSNVYAKLGISSRAAATAYAYDHGLV